MKGDKYNTLAGLSQSMGREEVVCSVADLQHQMRRMLRVQWKEFVHSIEDVEIGSQDKQAEVVSLRCWHWQELTA